MDFASFLRILRPVAETSMALAAAIALTLILTFPFIPVRHELDFRLHMSPERSQERSTPDELADEVRSLEIAERVEVTETTGPNQLRLSGVADPNAARERVFEILERRGYETFDPHDEQLFSLEQLLEPDSRVLPALLSVQATIFFVFGLLLARWRIGLRTAAASGPVRAVLLGLAAGSAAVLISVIMSSALTAIGLPVEEQEWIREILSRPGVLVRLVPWIVVIGPLAEEIFFRGYVFRAIRKEAGFPAGLIISSVMFAMIHVNLSGFLIYLMIGCVLGLAYQRSASLITPIVGHMTINSMVLLASVLVDEGDSS